MEKKNIFFDLEFLISFLLLFLLVFLYGDLISSVRLFIVCGLLIGLCVGWFTRQSSDLLTRRVIYLPGAAVIIWAVYALINSSLLYKDVILVCMHGVFFLSIILSFVSYSSGLLNYIQLFNIILLLGAFVLIKQHNAIFISIVSIYAFLFLIAIRLKLYSLAYIARKNKAYYTYSILVVFFLFIIFMSWALTVNITFERLRTKGLFLDEDLRSEDSKEVQKEAFLLQDEVQKEVTNWIFTLSTVEEQKNTLLLLSSLLQDWPYAAQTNNAEGGLKKTLEGQGAGLDNGQKIEQLTQMIGRYVDKKIASRLTQISDDVAGILRSQRVNLLDRISILNKMDRINKSDSHQEISRLGDELQDIIGKARTSDNTRKQLRELARQFREWKSYQIYHKQFSVTKEQINSLESNKKTILKDIIEQINKADLRSELLQIENKLGEFSKESDAKEKEAINNANEIMGLKTEMVAMKESRELEKRMDSAGLPKDKLKEFEGAVNTLNEADKPQQLLKATSQLMDSIKNDEKLRNSAEAKEILGTKLESFIKKTKEKIKKKIQESYLPDSGKQLLSDLEKMESAQENDELNSYVRSLNKEIDRFFREGFISKETRDDLIQDIKDMEQLLKRRLEVGTLAQEEKLTEETAKIDYQRDISKLLQTTTLEDEQRETLDSLMEKLNAAQTISQVEDVLEALEKEISSSSKRWSKEESEKIRELLRKLAEAKKKMLQTTTLGNEQREALGNLMERLNTAQTISQVEDVLEALEKEISSSAKKRSKEEAEKIKGLLKKAAEDKKELLQTTTLEDEQRETLDSLMEKLNAAQTISQVEDVLEALEKEISSSSKRWSKEESEKIRELLRKLAEAKKKLLIEENNHSLRKKVDELEKTRPSQAKAMKEKLEKMKASRTDKEYKENIESLEKELDSKREKESQLDEKESTSPAIQETQMDKRTESMRIYLLPSRVILPLGKRISFKNIAVYNKSLIRDVSSELEWFSSDPSIAFVDDKGIVQALTKGTAEVFVRHKGSTSEKAEVTVVDNILDDVRKEVENKLP